MPTPFQRSYATAYAHPAPHTVLEFGKPIDVASMDREQKKTLAKDVQDLIEKMYEENKALV